MAKSPRSKNGTNGSATVGYEAQLWQMADALRGSMDAAEYKHVDLGPQGASGSARARRNADKCVSSVRRAEINRMRRSGQ